MKIKRVLLKIINMWSKNTADFQAEEEKFLAEWKMLQSKQKYGPPKQSLEQAWTHF